MAIYDSYYGCRQEPFSLNPDPNFLYLTPRHREALAQLRYVTLQRKGFAVLTGEVGTGKTTILRKFLEDAGPEVTTGYMFNPPRSLDELQASISRELGLKGQEPGPFLSRLNDFLLQSMERDRVVVMIFDEAQALPVTILEEIRLLSNLETGSAKLLQIIMAGQPEFNAILDSVELRALRQRVALRCDLEPMSAEETVEYIGNRLRVAAARRSPFTFEACAQIHKYSRGIPRLINLLCDNSMLIGYASDSPVIGPSQVEQAADDLGLKERPAVLARARGRTTNSGNHAPAGQPLYSAALVSLVFALALVWLAVSGVGRRLYDQGGIFLQRANLVVTRVIDGSLNGAGLGASMTDPAAGSRGLTGSEARDRNNGAKNEQSLRSTTQGGTGKALTQDAGGP